MAHQLRSKNKTAPSFYRGIFLFSLLCSVSAPVLADATCLGTSHSGATAVCDYSTSPIRQPNDAIDATYKTVISDGTSTTISGTMVFQNGDNGFNGWMSLDALKDDFITITAPDLPADRDTLLEMTTIELHSKTESVFYQPAGSPDFVDFSVYADADITAAALKDKAVQTFHGVGDNQYLNLELGKVNDSGGEMIIEADFQNAGQAPGSLYIAAKQSTLFLADGTGSADSKIIWNVGGSYSIIMSAAATGEDDSDITHNMVSDWPVDVEVTLNDGSSVTHQISDLTSLLAFNNTLKQYIENNQIDGLGSPAYDNYIQQALNKKPVTIEYTKQVEAPQSPDDFIYTGSGTKAIMRAIGENASLEIAANSSLEGLALNGVLYAQSGASAINNGTISVGEGTAIRLTSQPTDTIKSSGENNHIINVGYQGTGASVHDSTFHNNANGIINVALTDEETTSYGIAASNQSIVRNDGFINVGINPGGGLIQGGGYGAHINNSHFTNTGTIYIGREAQNDISDNPAATHLEASEPVSGIHAIGTSVIDNTGHIIIGEYSDGINAISAEDSSDAQISHSGEIIIYGDTTRTRANKGFYIYNSGTRTETGGVVTHSIRVEETGTINLQGGNAAGMHVIADGTDKISAAASAGHIIVEGGRDPMTGTRNYGVWAEGINGGHAIIDMTGVTTLSGQGAIGVHARDKATVNVIDNGNVIFDSGTNGEGTDQIGYFIYGSDARIHVLRNSLSVTTERSNLFRVDNGAIFDGQDYHIEVSGIDSLGVLGTGANTLIDIKEGRYDITGDGATAIRIGGGAKGWIYDSANINLTADNTRGIIADGNRYNIYNQLTLSNDANTEVNASTNIYATADNVIGFTAINAATLNYMPNHLLSPSPLGLGPTTTPTVIARFLGDNSIAFHGGNNSTFNIAGNDLYVNGWAFDIVNGGSTINIEDSVMISEDGILNAYNYANNPIITMDVDRSVLHGIIQSTPQYQTNLSLQDSIWNRIDNSNMQNLVVDNSHLSFSHISTSPANYRTLDIAGNYDAINGAQITMFTKLDDAVIPQTDLLRIGGDTSGETTLFVWNTDGKGGLSENDGIKLVEIGGMSDGNFILGRKVFAGAYEYGLFKGTLDGIGGDWYLRSTNQFRPEVPIYLGAPGFASRFGLETIGNYHDRIGARSDHISSEGWNDREKYFTWGRILGSFGKDKQRRINPDNSLKNFLSHGPSYNYDMGGIQAGMDLYRSLDGGHAKHFSGVYLAATHGTSDVNNVFDGDAGKLRQTSYSLGGYWTIHAPQNNWYIDSVIQASYHKMNGKSFLDESSHSHGWGYAASIEAGYEIPLAADRSWIIEPQIQGVYQHQSLNDITDPYGHINFDNSNHIYGRVGLRLATNSATTQDNKTVGWVRTNLWHDFSEHTHVDFTNLDHSPSLKLKIADRGTWGQFGGGITHSINDRLSIYASGDYEHALDTGKGSSINGRIGLKINW